MQNLNQICGGTFFVDMLYDRIRFVQRILYITLYQIHHGCLKKSQNYKGKILHQLHSRLKCCNRNIHEVQIIYGGDLSAGDRLDTQDYIQGFSSSKYAGTSELILFIG